MARFHRSLAKALILVSVTVIAYWPTTNGGFVWDDEDHVQPNLLDSADGLRRIWLQIKAAPQYYPLVYTSFWIEYRLWGLHPAGYHTVNVLLHAVSAVLLWRLLRGLDVPGAWAAGALFALHPVHVESVAWISERKNVLSGAFYLASAMLYLRFVSRERSSDTSGPQVDRHVPSNVHLDYAASLVFYLCALLSKTVTCTLPAALLLVLWWKRRRIGAPALWRLFPFFATGMALGLLTVWLEKHHVGASGAEWELSLVERLLIAGRALWFYAGKLIWPARLTFIYERWQISAADPWHYLFPAAAALVVIVLWLARQRMGRGPLVAVLFFMGTLAPALGFFDVYPMRFAFVADHFQYLASLGLIVLAAALAAHAIERFKKRTKSMAVIVALLVLVILGTLTWRQTHIYRDQETLWRNTLEKNPGAWMAHTNLGNILGAQQNHQQAIEHYRAALQIKPDYAEAHYNIGITLRAQGSHVEAARHYRRAIAIRPKYAEAHNNLGNLLAGRGEHEEAIKHFRLALAFKPDDSNAHNNLGAALQTQGRLDEAIRHHRRSLAIKRDFADAHNNLGVALQSQGRVQKAINHFRRALQINRHSALAELNLGKALGSQRRFDLAQQHLRRALQLGGDSFDTHYFLGLVLKESGQLDRAGEHFSEALRLKPGTLKALKELAWILAIRPQPAGRHDQAVRFAERAVQMTEYRDAAILDTLAAAYAAAGRFEAALETAEKASELARATNDDELARRILRRREFYRVGEPYRQE